ncbi:MAG: outer membrane lipoprotein-sorting protein [Halarsenatibacteraceae bacterium]
MKRKLMIISLVLAIVVSFASSGLSQELSGDEVLDRVKETMNANTIEMNFRMELHSSEGDIRERQLKIYSKEGEGDTNKALIRFLEPASVEGTGFLNLVEENQEDMYLFLPAIGSVRRIASGQRSGSFVGTEFSYNDLSVLGGGNFQEDYQPTVIEENEKEYIIRIDPTAESNQYEYGIMHVQKSNWFPARIEFYDSNEELWKVLTNENFSEQGDYLMAEKITMKNVQKGTKTVLYLNEVTYDGQIDDDIFTTRYLERY